MASKQIFLLENEDMMTSKLDSSSDTKEPDIKQFRPEMLTHIVCKSYFIIFNLTFIILLFMITAILLEGIRKT